MTLPTIVQLQRSGFGLQLWGRDWANDLLAGLNAPVTPVPKGIFAAGRVMRAIRMNHGLLFTNSLSSALSMRLAGIRTVGYRAKSRSLVLHTILEKSPGRHEVEHFWRLGEAAVRFWGLPASTWPAAPPAQMHLPVTNAHRVAAANALALARINGPYTVCCPLAFGRIRGQSKRWPLFPEFCRALAAMDRVVVICPGPGEENECDRFLANAVVLPGLSLGVFAAIMSGAQEVVANDTGPMHLAAAVGARVLGIFGPSDPLRTRPWGGLFVGGSDRWPDLDTVLKIFGKMPQARHVPPPMVHSQLDGILIDNVGKLTAL